MGYVSTALPGAGLANSDVSNVGATVSMLVGVVRISLYETTPFVTLALQALTHPPWTTAQFEAAAQSHPPVHDTTPISRMGNND